MIRRGAKVRYIGDRFEYAKGKVFKVLQKSHSGITLYFPCRYMDGSLHKQQVYMPISEFEEVKG